ncbi:MAG TPA: c-type cytochrome [Bryobacteraceae bacterium]|nr:c-type cytochrome [Bryobacteraceae bacterium]
MRKKTFAILGGMVLLAGVCALAADEAAVVEKGQTVFRRDCAFCHGRDAAGGESGPDLTRSKLVAGDAGGAAIGPVVRNGRPGQGMPAFHLPEDELAAVVAFLHGQHAKAEAKPGERRGVDVADLQTGDAAAGKQYFEKACAGCHSPEKDLKGIASRVKGLALEQRMLYPRNAKATVTVTPADGAAATGTLAYLDEFTVALKDAAGTYRSWAVADVQYKVSAPADAHADLLPRYTDADIHNLMAYLQTLR